MRIMARIAQWLFVLCLPFLFLSASIAGAANSAWLYTSGFEKYDVPQALADAGLPLDQDDFRDIARGFIRYFNSGEELVTLTVTVSGRTVDLFTPEETQHFKDVKSLFRLDYAVLLGTVLYVVAYASVCIWWRGGTHRRNLARSVFVGSAATLAVMALLGIIAVVDFNAFWLFFHLVSFSNEFWSAQGNMLLLFPGGFWYDMVVIVALAALGMAVVLGCVAGVYPLRLKKREKPGHDQHS